MLVARIQLELLVLVREAVEEALRRGGRGRAVSRAVDKADGWGEL